MEKARGENNHEAQAIVHFRQGQRAVAREYGLEKVSFVPTADGIAGFRNYGKSATDGDTKSGSRDFQTAKPLPTKELNDEHLSRGNHWYCHYNGSASNYCLIGYALAQSLINEE